MSEKPTILKPVSHIEVLVVSLITSGLCVLLLRAVGTKHPAGWVVPWLLNAVPLAGLLELALLSDLVDSYQRMSESSFVHKRERPDSECPTSRPTVTPPPPPSGGAEPPIVVTHIHDANTTPDEIAEQIAARIAAQLRAQGLGR